MRTYIGGNFHILHQATLARRIHDDPQRLLKPATPLLTVRSHLQILSRAVIGCHWSSPLTLSPITRGEEDVSDFRHLLYGTAYTSVNLVEVIAQYNGLGGSLVLEYLVNSKWCGGGAVRGPTKRGVNSVNEFKLNNVNCD